MLRMGPLPLPQGEREIIGLLFLLPLPLWERVGVRGAQSELDSRQPLRERRRQHHVLDAEAGIERRDLLGEEARQVARVAAGARRADGGALDLAVHAIAGKFEAAGAAAFRGEAAAELLGQEGERPREILPRRDRPG